MLALKAVGANPPQFYELLRWVTFIVAGAGTRVALGTNQFGWMFTLVAIVVLYNPLFPVRLDRSTWFPLNLTTAGLFLAASVFLRWNHAGPWLRRAKNAAENTLAVIVFTVGLGVWGHFVLVIAVVAVGLFVPGDEQFGESWVQFRDRNLAPVALLTVIAVWLYGWISSPEAARRFCSTTRKWTGTSRTDEN